MRRKCFEESLLEAEKTGKTEMVQRIKKEKEVRKSGTKRIRVERIRE